MRTHRISPTFPVVPRRPVLRLASSPVLSAQKPLYAGNINSVSVEIYDNADAARGHTAEPAALAAANHEIDRLFSNLNVGQATISLMAWGDTMIPAWHQRAQRISQKLLERPQFFTEFFGGAFFAQGDEFVGIDNSHPQSAVPYFLKHFLDRIQTPEAGHREMLLENNFFFIDGQGHELGERNRFYAWLKGIAQNRSPEHRLTTPQSVFAQPGIRSEATFGLGPGCHVLFCEAENGPFLHLPFGKIALSRETRQRQDASYTSDFSHAFTLREEMFWPERINFIVTRANKANEVFRSFGTAYSEQSQAEDFCPAREFQNHRNVHLYCSLAAGERLIPFLQSGDKP